MNKKACAVKKKIVISLSRIMTDEKKEKIIESVKEILKDEFPESEDTAGEFEIEELESSLPEDNGIIGVRFRFGDKRHYLQIDSETMLVESTPIVISEDEVEGEKGGGMDYEKLYNEAKDKIHGMEAELEEYRSARKSAQKDKIIKFETIKWQ